MSLLRLLKPLLAHALPGVLMFVLLVGCEGSAVRMNIPEPDTPADSLALLVLDANGGQQAWESLRYLQFSYATLQSGTREDVARHLWDRAAGFARVEWRHGDSLIVALLDLEADEGQVFVDGVPADTASYENLLLDAIRRHVNDTYWLMAPVFMFEPGVTRHLNADASSAEVAVLEITPHEEAPIPFGPHAFYVERETGNILRWAIPRLQMTDAPGHTWNWLEYRDYEVPGGSVRFSTRKERTDGSLSVQTDQIETPSVVVDTMFTARNPIL